MQNQKPSHVGSVFSLGCENKGVRGTGLWGEGCVLLLRWWGHAVAQEPAGKNK